MARSRPVACARSIYLLNRMVGFPGQLSTCSDDALAHKIDTDPLDYDDGVDDNDFGGGGGGGFDKNDGGISSIHAIIAKGPLLMAVWNFYLQYCG